MFGILHKIKGLFIEEYDLKKEVSNIVAVAIFMDSIIRPSEVKQGYEILENLFNGEDYEFLKNEVDLLLEDFQEEARSFLDAKEKALIFIRSNKSMRRELIDIVKLIFKSDHSIHSKEAGMLEVLEKESAVEVEK